MCFSCASTNYSRSLIIFRLEYYGYLIFIFRGKIVVVKFYVFLMACATEDRNEVWNVQC
jgi:hypothetical protein